MSASSTDAVAIREALSTLGLAAAVDAAALKAAFHVAVKAARPDHPGGDPERFRRVIAAYRLIQAHGSVRPALSAPKIKAEPAPALVITPQQALSGGVIDFRHAARDLRITIPVGLRSGDHVRLRNGSVQAGDLYLPVLIRPNDGLSAMGDDLFMTWPAAPRLLEEGGRIEIQTHAGLRSAWITPDLASPVRIRLKGLGLPMRSGRAAGHLFVTLSPSRSAPSAAEELLARFTRSWRSEPLAA